MADSGTGGSGTEGGTGAVGQGRQAAAAGRGGPPDTALSEGERMARKLVRDVAAYEVDPPPPDRVQGAGQSGPGQSGEPPAASDVRE